VARIKNTKFTVEGFQKQADWIGKLLAPLNTLMNDLIFAFNNNITMENLSQEIKELRFKNNSVDIPIQFQQKLTRRATSVQIVYCYDHDNDTTKSVSTLPVWSSARGLITINSISGLDAGGDYTIKVHVIYED
jgi:hypothetical protein